MSGTRFAAIITARGGSTRLPRKNVLSLCGKPLIAHTIEAALASSYLDRVIVSTDDDEIAEVSLAFGAEVPFRRPPELATAEARSVGAILHAMDWLKQNENYEPEYIVLLQPTCPLRTAQHIDEAIELCLERDADSVVALCEPKHHPYWLKVLDADGRIHPFMQVNRRKYHRKQELPSVYASNSSIYVVRSSVLWERQEFYTDRSYAYLMDASVSLDIDDEWDFYFAELVLQSRNRQ